MKNIFYFLFLISFYSNALSPSFLGISSSSSGSCTLGSATITCAPGSSTILGNVFLDGNANCQFDTTDCGNLDLGGINIWEVEARSTSDASVYSSYMNEYGAYYVCVDSGNYNLYLLFDSAQYEICNNPDVIYNVLVGNGSQSSGNDFGLNEITTAELTQLLAPYDGKIDQKSWGNMWVKSITGATSYTLQLSTDPGFGTIDFNWSSSTHQFANYSGLTHGTTYYSRAKSNLNSNFGVTTSFTTINALNCIVTSPANNSIGVALTASIWVNWQDDGVDKINYEIATDMVFTNIIATHSNTTGTPVSRVTPSLQTLGLMSSTTYFVRAQSHKGATTGAYSSVVQFTTVEFLFNKITHPAQAATNVGLNEYIWCNIQEDGVDQIEYEIATDMAFTNIVSTHTNNIGSPVARTTPSLDSLGLDSMTTYFVRAKSYDLPLSGNYSEIISFTTVGSGARKMANKNTENSFFDKNSIVKAYPNPFQNVITLHIEAPTNTSMTLRIMDATGKLISKSNDFTTNQSFTVGENLENGMYIIQAIHKHKIETFKIVKKK